MSSVSNSIAAATPPWRGRSLASAQSATAFYVKTGERVRRLHLLLHLLCIAGRGSRAAGFPYTRTEPPVCQIRKQLVFTFHLLTEGFCSVNKNCAQLQKKRKKTLLSESVYEYFLSCFGCKKKYSMTLFFYIKPKDKQL